MTAEAVERLHCPHCKHFVANFAGTYLDPRPCISCGAISIWRSMGGALHCQIVKPGRIDRAANTLHPPPETT
jgi:hypothetical protein